MTNDFKGIFSPNIHTDSREAHSLSEVGHIIHGLEEEVVLAIHDQGFWFLK
jgi:hypothetical protein